MNKIVATGRLSRDPQLTLTKGNIPLCRFTVCSRDGVDQDGHSHTDFFPCVAWRERAENIVKYCKKGSLVSVFGRMSNRDYKDAVSGQDRQIWELNVENIEFLSLVKESGEKGQQNASNDVPSELTEVDDEQNLPF